jgi:hypothetical protein
MNYTNDRRNNIRNEHDGMVLESPMAFPQWPGFTTPTTQQSDSINNMNPQELHESRPNTYFPYLVSPVAPHFGANPQGVNPQVAPSPMVSSWFISSPAMLSGRFRNFNDDAISPFATYASAFMPIVPQSPAMAIHDSYTNNYDEAVSAVVHSRQQKAYPTETTAETSTIASDEYQDSTTTHESSAPVEGFFLTGSCHQCKKRKSDVVPCATERCRKKYCVSCLVRIYGITDYSGNVDCPACVSFCNCARCTRKTGGVPKNEFTSFCDESDDVLASGDINISMGDSTEYAEATDNVMNQTEWAFYTSSGGHY